MRTVLSACLAFAAALMGCVGPETQLPTVTYQGAALAQAPSQEMMAAYYCPQVVPPDPFGLGLTAAACAEAFGAAPPAPEMVVAFNLQFNVHNPNHFPIPVAEMLTAVTLFPGQSSQPLGTSCVVFCSPDESGCTGQPGPDSCTAKSGDIRSIGDFTNATANLIVASGVSLLEGQAPSFKMPEVVQDGEAAIEARFAFGADPMLQALEQLASQSVDQLADGTEPTFTIPYRIEGTVWLDVGSLGRVAVGFGPVDGTWTIPASKLVPSL
jgi:hypothetical protein